jgi:molybdate/tungstate transport system permease protein
MANNPMKFLFAGIGSLLILFIALPLAQIFLASPPSQIWAVWQDTEVQQAIFLTLFASAIATVFALIAGIPLAYILARVPFRGKQWVEALIDLPVVVPHSAAGIALLMVFGRKAWLGKIFEILGVSFVSATPGIVIAMLFVSLSFLVNAARDGFRSVDPRMEAVARTLGATPWQSFWRITLPLAKQSILSGTLMMWARGLSEFGAVVILAYHPMVAPVLVYERFESYGLDYARPVAALIIFISLVVFFLLRYINGKETA